MLVRKIKYVNELKGLSDVLNELNANYRLSLSISEQDEQKVKTLKPELEFIKVLFGALSQDLSGNIPFTMFWATSGQYVTKNIFNKLENKESFIEKFKTIFKKLYTDAQNNIYSNRIEAVYKLFDEYDIWNCLSHKFSDDIDLMKTRRLFCHILTRAQLAENKKTQDLNSTSFIDTAKAIIEKGDITLSSYSIETEDILADKNSIDVITIHG